MSLVTCVDRTKNFNCVKFISGVSRFNLCAFDKVCDIFIMAILVDQFTPLSSVNKLTCRNIENLVGPKLMRRETGLKPKNFLPSTNAENGQWCKIKTIKEKPNTSTTPLCHL